MGKNKPRVYNHSHIVKTLARRLRDKGCLDMVITNEFYDRGKYRGEVDVLGRAGERWRFYEVKSRDTTNAYAHAVDQYWRYCKAHPERNVTGIYVTATCVERMPRYRPGSRNPPPSSNPRLCL